MRRSFTREQRSGRRPQRILAALIGLALLATACASTATTTSATNTEVSVAESETDGAGDTGSTEADDAAADAARAEAEAQVAARGEIRETLDERVQFASQSWSTDWTQSTIDVTELRAGLNGADTRDGIPPIDRPQYESVEAASEWLADNEPGALVQIEGEAWFFPLGIMTAHEIVNDTLGGIPVAVTYCPLCNTAIAYDRRVGGDTLRFGVSGLLRKSDLVMWDDLTTSLWQQISGEGIVGEYAGVQLEPVSTAIVSFGQFASGFPDGLSLSPDTGFGRSYGNNPYSGYSSSAAPIPSFFVDEVDDRLPALSRVVGVSIDGVNAAYPFSVLSTERVVNDAVNGEPLAVFWGGNTADALDGRVIAESQPIGSAVAYLRTVDGQELTFSPEPDGAGFIDAETGSRWNILGQATDGDLAGRQLETALHKNEFWFAFAGFFPDATIYTP